MLISEQIYDHFNFLDDKTWVGIDDQNKKNLYAWSIRGCQAVGNADDNLAETIKDDISKLKRSHLSKTGDTYGLGYIIASIKPIGKGYEPKILIGFVHFLQINLIKRQIHF